MPNKDHAYSKEYVDDLRQRWRESEQGFTPKPAQAGFLMPGERATKLEDSTWQA